MGSRRSLLYHSAPLEHTWHGAWPLRRASLLPLGPDGLGLLGWPQGESSRRQGCRGWLKVSRPAGRRHPAEGTSGSWGSQAQGARRWPPPLRLSGWWTGRLHLQSLCDPAPCCSRSPAGRSGAWTGSPCLLGAGSWEAGREVEVTRRRSTRQPPSPGRPPAPSGTGCSRGEDPGAPRKLRLPG